VCVIQERSFVRDRSLLPWSILIPCPVNSLKLYKGNVVMPREAFVYNDIFIVISFDFYHFNDNDILKWNLIELSLSFH
jgi:hypothetical protein